MSAPAPGGGRGAQVEAPGSSLGSLTKHGFQQPRLDQEHLGIFQVFGNSDPRWDIFPFQQRPHLECLETKPRSHLGKA